MKYCQLYAKMTTNEGIFPQKTPRPALLGSTFLHKTILFNASHATKWSAAYYDKNAVYSETCGQP